MKKDTIGEGMPRDSYYYFSCWGLRFFFLVFEWYAKCCLRMTVNYIELLTHFLSCEPLVKFILEQKLEYI